MPFGALKWSEPVLPYLAGRSEIQKDNKVLYKIFVQDDNELHFAERFLNN